MEKTLDTFRKKIRQSKLRKTLSSSYRKLEKVRGHLEETSFSVRQLIAQRERLFELIDLSAKVSTPENVDNIGAVLHEIPNTGSQFYQDIFALLVSRGKTKGFFVEFGACDGVQISNSYILEKKFGWSGILAEPSKEWHKTLRENRSCNIDTRCVWSESGAKIPFYEADDYVSSSLEASHMEVDRKSKYNVETISLEDLLKEYNAPDYIDLLSADTEGSEYEILKDFPFDKYRFGFVCVEHHHDYEEGPIKELMERHGYKQVFRHVSGYDGFYVPYDMEF